VLSASSTLCGIKDSLGVDLLREAVLEGSARLGGAFNCIGIRPLGVSCNACVQHAKVGIR
jgi:hypothetical protein